MVVSSSFSSVASATSSTLASAMSNVALVGSGWMFSSIVFSTYYTTLFLKHDNISINNSTNNGRNVIHSNCHKKNDFESRQLQVMTGSPASSPVKSKMANAKENENAINTILQSMSRPQLLTLYRFSGSLLMGTFLHPQVMRFGKRLAHTLNYSRDFSLAAIFLFVANYCNSIALDRIGISLTYTSKCIIPLITVLMTLIVDGVSALPSNLALLMLIPIASGVALASWNSPTFETKGFVAAMLSSTAQAALNVSSKRALIQTGISGLEAQRSMASVAFSIAICLSVLQSCFKARARRKESNGKGTSKEQEQDLPPFGLSLAAAAAYHFEYVLAFMFLNMVQPISYGTCDAIRRLGIIIAGRTFFGGAPFSMLNYSGIGCALLGAMGYSIASAKH